MNLDCGRVAVFSRVLHSLIPGDREEKSVGPLSSALPLCQVGHCCTMAWLFLHPGLVDASACCWQGTKTAGNSDESILGPVGGAGCNLNGGNFSKGT